MVILKIDHVDSGGEFGSGAFQANPGSESGSLRDEAAT
jgi:hypothetical protein